MGVREEGEGEKSGWFLVGMGGCGIGGACCLRRSIVSYRIVERNKYSSLRLLLLLPPFFFPLPIIFLTASPSPNPPPP